MALREMDDKGRMRVVTDLDYRDEFDAQWNEYPPEEQQAIDRADVDESIGRFLDVEACALECAAALGT
jgi:hypothetical protein